MDENAIITLIAIETIAPKRRFTRSTGGIYIILIALIIASMSVGNLLYERLFIPRYVTQPILYAVIAAVCYVIYRRNYLRYRYTLTTNTLAIEQIGGNEEKTLAAIDLSSIHQIQHDTRKERTKTRTVYAYLPPRKSITWVLENEDGKETRYAISASSEFLDQLNAQWRLAKPVDENH